MLNVTAVFRRYEHIIINTKIFVDINGLNNVELEDFIQNVTNPSGIAGHRISSYNQYSYDCLSISITVHSVQLMQTDSAEAGIWRPVAGLRPPTTPHWSTEAARPKPTRRPRKVTNYFQFWARVGAPPFESSQVRCRDLRVPPDRASQWRPGTGIGPALVAWQLKGDEIPAGDSPGRLPSLPPPDLAAASCLREPATLRDMTAHGASALARSV